MKEIVLNLREKASKSVVRCGKGAAEELPVYVKRHAQNFVFTDETVDRLYGDQISALTDGAPRFAMPAGERYKQPETLFALLGKMAEAGLHRGACLYAVGGGVVGDVGGLAAALYMRGIDCVQVPTTLLAQVDSSVGGKTAVDFGKYKNIVGAFKQPEVVLADSEFFQTLPEREIRCGLGEIVKHGALNADLFDLLCENEENLFDRAFLASVVPLNIAHKARVVEEDEKETGLRKSLNLGHTTGHAVELVHGEYSHGEYVLVGMLYEAELARKYCSCDGAYLDRLQSLVRKVLGAEFQYPPVAAAIEYAKLDKKNGDNDTITLTAPVAKGRYELLNLPFAVYGAELLRLEEKIG